MRKLSRNPFYLLDKRGGHFGISPEDQDFLDYLIQKKRGKFDNYQDLNLLEKLGFDVDNEEEFEAIKKYTYDNFTFNFYSYLFVESTYEEFDEDTGKLTDIVRTPTLLIYSHYTQKLKKIDVINPKPFVNQIPSFDNSSLDKFNIKIDMSRFEESPSDLSHGALEDLFRGIGKEKKLITKSEILTYTGSPAKIYEEIYNEVKAALFLEKDSYYHLMTCLIIASYFVEVFSHYPIIWVNGPAESGKSTTGELLESLGYFGYKVAATTKADFEAMIDHFLPMAIFDEQENEQNRKIIEPALNDGYRHGSRIGKRRQTYKGWSPGGARVYGFKCLIGINENLLNDVTETRTIPIYTRRRKIGRGERPPARVILSKISTPLRDRMYFLRFIVYNQMVKAFEYIANKNVHYSTSERMNTLFYPFITVAEVFGSKDEKSIFHKKRIMTELIRLITSTEESRDRLKYDPVHDAFVSVFNKLEKGWKGQWIATKDIAQEIHTNLSVYEKEDLKVNTDDNRVFGKVIFGLLRKYGFKTDKKDMKRCSTKGNLVQLTNNEYNQITGNGLRKKEGPIINFIDEIGNNEESDYIRIDPEALQARIDTIKTPSHLMKFFTELATANDGVLCMEAFYEGLEKTEGFNDAELEDVKKYAGGLVDELTERGLLHTTGKEGEFRLKV